MTRPGRTQSSQESRRRWPVLAGAISGALVASLAASAIAPAISQVTPSKRLSFLIRSMSQVASDPHFPQAGDTTVATSENLRHGKRLGADRTACLVVDSHGNLQCTTSVGLTGGQLQAAFTQNLTSETITGVIGGGTGRYAATRGTFTLRRIHNTSNFNAVITLR